jgi:hypothetical protein
MLDQIDFNYFTISFCIGILFIYLIKPSTKIVNKFPSPTNKDTIYKDNSNNCYKYKINKTSCTNDAKPQPIIEDFFIRKKIQ